MKTLKNKNIFILMMTSFLLVATVISCRTSGVLGFGTQVGIVDKVIYLMIGYLLFALYEFITRNIAIWLRIFAAIPTSLTYVAGIIYLNNVFKHELHFSVIGEHVQSLEKYITEDILFNFDNFNLYALIFVVYFLLIIGISVMCRGNDEEEEIADRVCCEFITAYELMRKGKLSNEEMNRYLEKRGYAAPLLFELLNTIEEYDDDVYLYDLLLNHYADEIPFDELREYADKYFELKHKEMKEPEEIFGHKFHDHARR